MKIREIYPYYFENVLIVAKVIRSTSGKTAPFDSAQGARPCNYFCNN